MKRRFSMAISKSAKIMAEMEKVKAKISDQQARLKELEQKHKEAENDSPIREGTAVFRHKKSIRRLFWTGLLNNFQNISKRADIRRKLSNTTGVKNVWQSVPIRRKLMD